MMAVVSDSKPITRAQITSIHVALQRRGISDLEYRALLQVKFGVGSCKLLSRRQASELLTKLGSPLPNPPGARRRPPAARPPRLPAGVQRLPTPPQRQLVEKLRAEAFRSPSDESWTAWLRDNMGIASGRVATSEQAARVIEALKAMTRRKQ